MLIIDIKKNVHLVEVSLMMIIQMTGWITNTLNVYGVKNNFIYLLFIKMPERPIPTTFLREFAMVQHEYIHMCEKLAQFIEKTLD